MQSSRESDKDYWLSWRYSDGDKDWAASGSGVNWYASEGGLSSVDQLQDTFELKSDFTSKEISSGRATHKLRVGAELSYQKISRNVVRDYYYSGSAASTRYLGDLGGAACTGDIFGLSLCSPAVTTNGYNGQFIKYLYHIPANKFEFDAFNYAFYVEDDVRLPLGANGERGELGARLGLRGEGDNYMNKKRLAPRFSLAYTTPVREEYRTRVVFGANRYYGRNLFNYKLHEQSIASAMTYNRTSVDGEWVAQPAAVSRSTKFNELRVPFSDEFMLAVTQRIGLASATLKYIRRNGRDEIMTRTRSASGGNAPALDGYATNYTFYTNDGRSTTDSVSLLVQNAQPFYTAQISHSYQFAADYSRVKRGYNYYYADENYIADEDVLYDGRVMKYSERPVQSFARPYSVSLNAIHGFSLGQTKWSVSNFLRYRSAYERTILLNSRQTGYDPAYAHLAQYAKAKFDGALTWDLRVGFELDFWRGNKFYLNADVINVLNSRHKTTTSNAYGTSQATSLNVAASAVAVYETGRQFWLQVGYKY